MGSSAVTGLVVAVAVLVMATAFGLWRNRHDGRLRPVADDPAPRSTDQPPAESGSGPVVGNGGEPAVGGGSGSVAGSGGGSAVGRGDGPGQDASVPALPSDDSPAMLAADDAHTAVDRTLLDLGVDPATPVTLVQFSSAFCAPCRTTRRVLADVAGLVDGVTHLEVDAESHLDAVRALDIWRTPTTLIVAGGRVVQRASGVPAKAQVLAAVAPMLDRAA